MKTGERGKVYTAPILARGAKRLQQAVRVEQTRGRRGGELMARTERQEKALVPNAHGITPEQLTELPPLFSLQCFREEGPPIVTATLLGLKSQLQHLVLRCSFQWAAASADTGAAQTECDDGLYIQYS